MDEKTALINLNVDENSRIITIPTVKNVFGIEGDIEVNRLTFSLPRYYSGFDMSEFSVRVNYVNANKEANYYEVDDATSDEENITFSWLMGSDVTAYVGDVKFSIKLYKKQDSKVIKVFNTKSGVGTVYAGLDVEDTVTPEEQQTLLEQIEAEIKEDLNTYTEEKLSEIQNSKNEAVNSIDGTKTEIIAILDDYKTATAGYAQTAKTCADSTAADRQAVQNMAAQVTADKATVAENTAKVAEDRTAAETAAQTAQAVAESIPADYSGLANDVSQLNEDLTELKTNQPNLFWRTGSNLLDETLLVDGSRLGSDGNIMNDFPSGCATVSYIDISSFTGKYVSAYTTVNGTAMRCFYRISFYESESKSGHLKTYSAAGVADMSQSVVEIPEGAKFLRVSYSYTSSTGGKFMLISGESNMKLIPYEKYHLKISIVPENLNDILNNHNDILNKYIFGTYPHHEDNAAFTISKLRNSFTFNQNDFTFVKDELWLAKCSTTDFSNGTGIFRYKWDGEQFVHIGTINCDFGHWNVVDYCEANDCLIFGNGANDFETEGNYFVVVPHPLELGDTALIADVGIKYNVNIGYKVQALWGDSNLGENNIAVLLSNDLKTIVKVLLKRDLSGNFNGEFIELERKENLPAFGIQGADIWDNTLYVGGAESSGMYTINKVSLSDYSSVKNSVKYYKDDGTPYLGVVQGVYVGGNYVWVFVNTDAPQTGKCCFLTKYRR